MKPKKEQFIDMDEDWIHTEVLGQNRKNTGFFSNCIIIIVLVFAVVLLIIIFQGMFEKQDLSNLEHLEQLEKQAEEQKKPLLEEEKAEEEEEETEEVVYIVESGDTLAYIGAKFGVDWMDIAERNGLEEPYELDIGQELIIPGVEKKETEEQEPSTEPSVTEGSTYIVKEGDTLAGIGLELGIPWEDIAQINNLEPPYLLMVGQELVIPEAE